MDYRDYNDNELLSYVCENNEEAGEIIFKKYEPLIKSIASRFYKCCQNSGLELNDIIQEGMLGLNIAINSYDEQKNTNFYNFAKKCIERRIMNVVTGTQRQKNKILNNSLSLEVPDEEKYKLDMILSDKKSNPEFVVITKENTEKIVEKINKNLTPFEMQVLNLRLSNFSYQEIGELLEKDRKAIDNAVQRIRLKVKKILKEIG